jgi:hypothetical protein
VESGFGLDKTEADWFTSSALVGTMIGTLVAGALVWGRLVAFYQFSI